MTFQSAPSTIDLMVSDAVSAVSCQITAPIALGAGLAFVFLGFVMIVWPRGMK